MYVNKKKNKKNYWDNKKLIKENKKDKISKLKKTQLLINLITL